MPDSLITNIRSALQEIDSNGQSFKEINSKSILLDAKFLSENKFKNKVNSYLHGFSLNAPSTYIDINLQNLSTKDTKYLIKEARLGELEFIPLKERKAKPNIRFSKYNYFKRIRVSDNSGNKYINDNSSQGFKLNINEFKEPNIKKETSSLLRSLIGIVNKKNINSAISAINEFDDFERMSESDSEISIKINSFIKDFSKGIIYSDKTLINKSFRNISRYIHPDKSNDIFNKHLVEVFTCIESIKEEAITNIDQSPDNFIKKSLDDLTNIKENFNSYLNTNLEDLDTLRLSYFLSETESLLQTIKSFKNTNTDSEFNKISEILNDTLKVKVEITKHIRNSEEMENNAHEFFDFLDATENQINDLDNQKESTHIRGQINFLRASLNSKSEQMESIKLRTSDNDKIFNRFFELSDNLNSIESEINLRDKHKATSNKNVEEMANSFKNSTIDQKTLTLARYIISENKKPIESFELKETIENGLFGFTKRNHTKHDLKDAIQNLFLNNPSLLTENPSLDLENILKQKLDLNSANDIPEYISFTKTSTNQTAKEILESSGYTDLGIEGNGDCLFTSLGRIYEETLSDYYFAETSNFHNNVENNGHIDESPFKSKNDAEVSTALKNWFLKHEAFSENNIINQEWFKDLQNNYKAIINKNNYSPSDISTAIADYLNPEIKADYNSLLSDLLNPIFMRVVSHGDKPLLILKQDVDASGNVLNNNIRFSDLSETFLKTDLKGLIDHAETEGLPEKFLFLKSYPAEFQAGNHFSVLSLSKSR